MKMDDMCASASASASASSSAPVIRLMTMEQPPSSSFAVTGSSSPAIDRHNPIITDSRRCAINPSPAPLPLPHKNRHKKKKIPKLLPPKEINGGGEKEMKKSPRKSWSCSKPGEFLSPPGSTRYLLNGKELLSAFDLNLFPPPPINSISNEDEDEREKEKEKPPTSSPSPDQVVVLRVSLHCRGCERKMRKHISRMEGVRSFNIDFAAKKVTVSGKVTPLEVLSSISKVKNAQLWPPSIAIASQSQFPSCLNLNNNNNNNNNKPTFLAPSASLLH